MSYGLTAVLTRALTDTADAVAARRKGLLLPDGCPRAGQGIEDARKRGLLLPDTVTSPSTEVAEARRVRGLLLPDSFASSPEADHDLRGAQVLRRYGVE